MAATDIQKVNRAAAAAQLLVLAVFFAVTGYVYVKKSQWRDYHVAARKHMIEEKSRWKIHWEQGAWRANP
jgi:hypothetical protein